MELDYPTLVSSLVWEDMEYISVRIIPTILVC